MINKLLKDIFLEVKKQSLKESLQIYFEPVFFCFKLMKLFLLKLYKILT